MRWPYGLRSIWPSGRGRLLGRQAVPATQLGQGRQLGRWSLSSVAKGLGAALVAVGVYYGLGSVFGHRIDDDPDFAPPPWLQGGSHAIAMAAALIEREVVIHEWSVNDPWFAADFPLDNSPNFQQRIISAIGRFSFEMLDHLGRARGSSRADPDLERAAGFLQFPGDIWLFDFQCR